MMLFARIAPIFFALKVTLAIVLSLGTAVWQWFKARAGRNLRSRLHPRGFTLIEIGVVLLIVVMLMGIAIPAISNVTGLKARAEIGKLAANIRATRGHAAVSGQTCRIVFDIDNSAYSVECAKGAVTIAAEEEQNGHMVTKAKDDRPDDDLTDSERMKRKIMSEIKFAAAPTIPPQKMKGGITIDSVWTSHQQDKYTKGKALLYFFPSGTAETANIVLRNGDDYFTVEVSPMVGKVTIVPKKVDKTEMESSDDDF